MKRLTALLIVTGLLAMAALPSMAQDWQQRAVLLTDVSADESDLWVTGQMGIVPDRMLLLESRDGTIRATYRVRHVFDNHVILYEALREEWVADSKVYQ